MTRQGRDDRRAGPARGGPVTDALARFGWLIGSSAGVVLMMMLAMAGAEGSVGSLLTWLAVLVPIGAVVGGAVGLAGQSVVRNRLLEPARRRALVAPGYGLRPHGRWERFYEACARSVARYHEIVATVSPGPGRDWLADIGRTLDAELAEALRLAHLGESLEPDELTAPGETVYHVLNRLRAAKTSFAETTERAAAIALDLRDHSDFVQVRAQLDMLAAQAPQLRNRA